MEVPKQIPLNELIASSKHETLLKALAAEPVSVNYAHSVGFHIYGDLRLKLHLAAAEDDGNASRYLDLLQDYAEIADACAKQVGAELLEVQGERVHLLLPSKELFPTPDSLRRLLGFSVSFTQTVYGSLQSKAGDDWDGFSMAADFGPAIILIADYGGGSVVSLGPAANLPAKRLGSVPGVPAGHCSIRRDVIKHLFNVPGRSEWVDINVLEPDQTTLAFSHRELTEGMLTLAKAVLAKSQSGRLVALASSSLFADVNTSTIDDPVRVQGMSVRADLDGFTKDVQNAFAGGPTAITALISRFRTIMEYPRQFAGALKRPMIELPWAGDCANVILLPRQDECYADITTHLPVTAAVAWHGQQTKPDLKQVPWNRAMGKTRWAVGIAGGDDDEGANGVLLVANVYTSDRRFRVVAGWGAKRSNDAYQADGVKADDTVLPITDYQELDSIYQQPFSQLDSRFMVASYEKLNQATANQVAELAKSKPAKVPVVANIYVPAPKPYWQCR